MHFIFVRELTKLYETAFLTLGRWEWHLLPLPFLVMQKATDDGGNGATVPGSKTPFQFQILAGHPCGY